MARFVKDLVLNKPEEFVTFVMNDYLQKNQFSMSDWKGEPAYRAGDAMLEGYKYLNWSYVNGTLHLEAWLKGTAGKEWDLDGFVAVAQKKPYKTSLEQLFTALQQDIPEGQDAAQAVPVKTVDNTGAATAGLVLGILSVLFVWSPIISILLAAVGISRARMGIGSSKAGMAKAGKILCIIGAIVAVILWILNIVLTVGMLV
mgnify:FL=1